MQYVTITVDSQFKRYLFELFPTINERKKLPNTMFDDNVLSFYVKCFWSVYCTLKGTLEVFDIPSSFLSTKYCTYNTIFM